MSTRHVIFAAAENGALPGGKVGGVADVIHDLPIALAAKGWQSTIVTPSYDAFHKLQGATAIASVDVWFRGAEHEVDVYEVPGRNAGVRNLVFEHPFFSPQGPGRIYCSDLPGQPFATDASKFAFFCAALAAWLLQRDAPPDVLHLQDWHTGFYFLLREFADAGDELKKIRTVFTIHNLSYQGIRPFAGHESSLEAWYPGMRVDLSLARDPRYADCVNPMAAAIRLSDRVSTVSPTYAKEICLASDPIHGFIGGEGMEEDLRKVASEGRLVGILNGCDYPRIKGRKPAWSRVVAMAREQVDVWLHRGNDTAVHELAARRLAALPGGRPRHVVVSIGRLVTQKVSLLLEPMRDKRTALEHLLERLGPHNLLLMLGSGEPHLEERILAIARDAPNLVFLRGYSEQLADPLYRSGDLFLMPSSFEPCGISQMLSMRVGVPCIVHGVGGLKDTVDDGVNGFVFDGRNPAQQAGNLVTTLTFALDLIDDEPAQWKKMRQAAARARFDWERSAQRTIEELYDY